MEFPLWGCGIGQFGAYTASLDRDAGRRAGWQGTHNTYTQVSSEAGIPALIVFLVLVVSCFRSLGTCYRRAVRLQTTRARDIANMAYALRTSLWAYAVFAIFSYMAYSATLPVIAGLTVGIAGVAESELAWGEREIAEKGAASVAGIGVLATTRYDNAKR
jgi:O-antigen ligase